MRTRTHIVFLDFDGVVVDTLDLTFSTRKMLEPDLTKTRFLEYFQGNIFDAVPTQTPSPELLEQTDRTYTQELSNIFPNKDIPEVVGKLAQTGEVIVISSSPSGIIRAYLSAHNMIAHITDVLGGDMHASKSAKMEQALASRQLSPEHAVLITDTAGDIREAHEIGVRTVAVTWGFHSKETLLEAQSETIVKEPSELPEVVRKIFDTRTP